jgi:hypothetical protein
MVRPSNTISLHDAVGLAVGTDEWVGVPTVLERACKILGANLSHSEVNNELHIGYLRMELTRRKSPDIDTQYKRSVSWGPRTDAGKCYNYQLMDKRFGTDNKSPLHHDTRCPLHGTDAMIRRALT